MGRNQDLENETGEEELSGTLYGIGVGPGDPELITLKALSILGRVPVIAYPATATGDSMARRIAAPHISNGQTELPIAIDIGVGHGENADAYDRGAADIALHLGAGRDVALLCEGDPLFYGSFMYVFARLAEDWPVVVVPGISSLNACAAALTAPLAGGGDVLSIIPATLDEDRLEAAIVAADAVAIIKIGRHYAKLAKVLDRLGLTGKARYIERVGMEGERSLPLGRISAAEVPYFSMVLVHGRGQAWS